MEKIEGFGILKKNCHIPHSLSDVEAMNNRDDYNFVFNVLSRRKNLYKKLWITILFIQ